MKFLRLHLLLADQRAGRNNSKNALNKGPMHAYIPINSKISSVAIRFEENFDPSGRMLVKLKQKNIIE